MPAEFASWLMSDCFDPISSQLVLPGRGRIAVTADAVSRVLGLRNSGDAIRYELDAEAIKFMTEQYGLERGLAPTIDTIIERLMKNREADDDFFRSWLMIVVSTFLCPTTGLSISSKCYPSLVDLSAVKNLNWCQFVVDKLKISSQESNKKNSVRGCLYFLVILYVDSLDVSTVQIPGTEPRIAAWTWKLLDKVIKLDTNPDKTFGKLNLKGPNHPGCSVIQNSLFHFDDIRRFVTSNVSKPMSNQKKRKLSEAVGQFFGTVADAMANFLHQGFDAGLSDLGPSSMQNQSRAKRARRSTARANQMEGPEPNENSDSSENSDYVAESDQFDSNEWESGDEKDMEDVLGDDMGWTGHGNNRDASVHDGADEVITEDTNKDGDVNKKESTNGAATNPSARIHQDAETENDKSTAKDEENDKQDNITLMTRLRMMKKALQPIPLDLILAVVGKDTTDDKVSTAAPEVAAAAMNKGSKEERRAKLKLPPGSVQVDDVLVHGSIKTKKSNSDPSKSNGSGQFIQRSKSLDFTPPRCDIMRFIDSDDANSQPDVSANSNLGNNGVHIEVEPVSASLYDLLDGIDLELVSKMEDDYLRAKAHAHQESENKEPNTDISERQQPTSNETPPFCLQQDVNANISDQQDASANKSITPTYQPPPRRHSKKPAVLRSPFIDFTRKRIFKCTKEVSRVYDAVCAHVRKSTRSSSQSPSKDSIIVDYHEVYATYQEVADSVKPGGKLLNTVAEVGIFALEPMGMNTKKCVFPLRFAGYLMAGHTERKEVTSLFASKRNHLDYRHLVMFPVLQEIQKSKDLEKVGHYFLLVLNLRNMRFEVLDSMRTLNDETLSVCCNTIVAAIKDLWKIHYPNSQKDIQNYDIIDIGVPVQNNTHDCGFHMLVHAEHWDGSSMCNFTEKDMPKIRMVLTHKWFTHPENNAKWKTLLNLG